MLMLMKPHSTMLQLSTKSTLVQSKDSNLMGQTTLLFTTDINIKIRLYNLKCKELGLAPLFKSCFT
jgi:hypothetical protein